MAMQTSVNGKIDRQTTCPFHLKLFYRTGGFHRYNSPNFPHLSPPIHPPINKTALNRLDDFPLAPHPTTSPFPPHLQIYTWPTCTLRELSHLLTSALPYLLPTPQIGTRLSYRLIYPDTRPSPPRYLAKDIGSVVVGGDGAGVVSLPTEEEEEVVRGGVMAGELGGEPEKTLQEARFVIGDFVDCAILVPGEGGRVAAPLRRGMESGGPRGGGYVGGRENDYGGGGGGYSGRGRGGGGRGGYGGSGGGGLGPGRLGGEGVPSGEWRRGESLPDRGYGGYGRGRGRGY
ncbi:MAG: hypothetical protein L6R41_001646 [Letrouitia leprolyta]|nr:MAG: hypothetical protein L6R41_001646 [Letrouitia leprolyta]